jgi:hypothetical protein
MRLDGIVKIGRFVRHAKKSGAQEVKMRDRSHFPLIYEAAGTMTHKETGLKEPEN